MPRDANGTTQVLGGTLVNRGDTVLPSQHNPAMTDLYAMMTQSLSRDGQGGMRANLSMNGFRITNVANGTLPNDAANMSQVAGIVPVGACMDFAGANAPAGWLLCFGQALPRADYPDLFAAIGTAYGGTGQNFNLPDCRGRVIAGRDDMGGTDAARLTFFGAVSRILGGVFGVASHILTLGQMPKHRHGGIPNTVTIPTDGWGTSGGGLGRVDRGRMVVGSGTQEASETLESLNSSALTSRNFTLTGNINSTEQGNDEAHTNAQPTIIMNKIIKVI